MGRPSSTPRRAPRLHQQRVGKLSAERAELAAPAPETAGIGEAAGSGRRDEMEKMGLWLWRQGRKDVGTRSGCVWLGHDAYSG